MTRRSSSTPIDAKIYANRGVIRTRQGKTDEAQKDFRKALELDPKLKDKRRAFSDAAKKMNAWTQRYFFTAIAAGLLAVSAPVWPAQIDEPLKAALELHDAGKVREALTEYDKVIKAHPKLAEAYFNRGNAYYDLGQNQQAIKDYSEAIRLNPKDAEGYYNRANSYRRLKQVDAALKDYTTAIKLNPEDVRSYMNRGTHPF